MRRAPRARKPRSAPTPRKSIRNTSTAARQAAISQGLSAFFGGPELTGNRLPPFRVPCPGFPNSLGLAPMAVVAKQAPVPPPAGLRVPCEKCPLRDNPCLRDFTAKELAFVAEFKSGELNVEAGTNVLLQGTNSAHLYTVLSGWAFRYKTLADGRRQILNSALPADLRGLQGSVSDEMQHSGEAPTDRLLGEGA